MAKIQDIDLPHLEFAEAAAPATPAAAIVRIYAKTDGLLYQKDDAGVETLLGSGTAGIQASIVDAKGDIIAATADNTVSRLVVGANDTVLTADSATATGLKWAAGGSGAVATDAIWDAAGDLAIGTGADTAARLAIGANGRVLTSNGTTATWAVAAGGSSPDFSGTPMGTLSHSYTFDTTVEDWTTTAGTLSSTGARLRLTHTSAAVGLEPSGATTVDDGEIDCLFNTTAITGSASVLFRAADTSNYYMITYQAVGRLSLYKCVAGGFTLLLTIADTSFPAIERSVIPQHRLMVRYVGSFIEVYVNGTMLMAVVDTQFSAAGYMGVRVDNATMEIDTVGIYDL